MKTTLFITMILVAVFIGMYLENEFGWLEEKTRGVEIIPIDTALTIQEITITPGDAFPEDTIEIK